MDFELTATAEAVASLARLKPLTACRDGRPRTQSIKIVWHDSPEHALLTQGQSLAEQRGVWRLERLVPGDETWLPAQPPPVLADPPDLSALPAPLAPLAAFDGRRTTSVHRFGDDPITLMIEKGTLRAVTAEQTAARICLNGDEAAIRIAALMIADAIPAAVPLVSLAAEGIALATGRSSSPRHLGAPTLPESLADVPAALAHIIGHLTDVMLACAPLAATLDDAGAEAVHQMRVAVRRARSAISIFRPAIQPGALDTINDRLRTLGRQLGPSRDWDVFTDETIPAIQQALAGDPRLERLATAASRRRRDHRAELNAYLKSAEFRKVGIELAWFAAAGAWRMPAMEAPQSLAAFSATVLQHRWKKLVTSGKRMEDLDVPALHGVRLRAKRARYAAEMFATLYHGKTAYRFIRRLSELQQRLGVLNDGAVALHLLDELGGAGGRHAYATGVVAGFMAARAGKMRPRIVLAFEKFRRQPAYWA